ncbi:hypothetical protein ABT093_20025 [Kitasatospora sp. NPDC002551]|uniref:hypothetical protein n=1 Tax=Kitasatospora sp. NPDC002551 TaxID=3154539 RepID=UPI0033250FC0
MSTAAQHTAPTPPPMDTLPQLRAALAGLSSLGIDTRLDRLEEDLATTRLDQVPALAERYRQYVRRNTTEQAVAALRMPVSASFAELREKKAAAR